MSNPLAKVIRYLASNIVLASTWTRVGTLATVTTSSNHGYASGFHKITASSSIAAIPNGNYNITVTGLNTFTLVCLNAGAANGTLSISYNGMQITASDVQSAIDQIDLLLTNYAYTLSNHKLNHQNGGVDELNVVGLNGLLADQQTPLGHVTRHQNGGDDELNVAGLNGLLADEQDAGKLKGTVINIAGLAVNYTLQYNGAQWIVTNVLSGVMPGLHASTHAVGGTDPILGELTDPQRAGKIFTAVINIAGLSDKWVLRYDSTSSTWIAQTFNHGSSHEQGGLDPISSLPTANEKAALTGTSGSPSNANRYVTDLDKINNITPLLPSVNQKAALDGSFAPTVSNPYITQQALDSAISSSGQGAAGFGVSDVSAFIHNQAVDRKGTPITIDIARGTAETSTVGGTPTDKPIAVLDRYCTIQSAINPGSSVFSSITSDVIVTNNISNASIASIIGNNGFDRGEITLTAAVPSIIQLGDTISVTGATDSSNNGQYKVYAVAGSVITVTVPMFANQASAAGTITSTKFIKDSIVVITGTVSNNNKFTITDVIGNTLTLFPTPVNETVNPTFQIFHPDGSIIAFGLMFITDGTPHNFSVSPVSQIKYEYDNSADHYGIFSSGNWIIGDQYNTDLFFVNIYQNISYGETNANITNASSPYTVLLNTRKIIADCSGGNIAVTLPAITADWHGVELKIKARAVGANAITITCNAADDIDGATNVVLNIQYQSWTLLANFDIGGNSFWSII